MLVKITTCKIQKLQYEYPCNMKECKRIFKSKLMKVLKNNQCYVAKINKINAFFINKRKFQYQNELIFVRTVLFTFIIRVGSIDLSLLILQSYYISFLYKENMLQLNKLLACEIIIFNPLKKGNFFIIKKFLVGFMQLILPTKLEKLIDFE
ncbi:hypothetical protein RFI_28275 [Reticulomyxa filosa]|uniref:Transmembrane protein n=1 Tax=Reticulomyxa filosa TaxID=46433 RepID=X6M633_RETFI|nr:hypothetical protein RFI_28275 [Reticulomyxa filosa]|eukprot:ETO09111.1 hypothetical protein RFI_28275 [Reticulomyxa filosa]